MTKKQLHCEAEWVPIGTVRPDPRNHRSHPAEQVRRIAESLRRYGWGRPILVRADGVVIAGHGTLAAAELLGMDEILIRRMALDPGPARELGLLDNALPRFAEDDFEAIEGIMASASADFRELVSDVDLLLSEGSPKPPLDIVDLDSNVFSGRWTLVVHGPTSMQPDALDALREHLSAIDGVDVEALWE